MVTDRFADLFSYLPSSQTARRVVMERRFKYLSWALLATAALLAFFSSGGSHPVLFVLATVIFFLGGLALFCVKMGEPHLRQENQIRNVLSNIIAYRRYPNGKERFQAVRGGDLSATTRLVLSCNEASVIGFVTNSPGQDAFLLPAGAGKEEPLRFRAQLLYRELDSGVFVLRGMRYYLSESETWEGQLGVFYSVALRVVSEPQPEIARLILENAGLNCTLEQVAPTRVPSPTPL